MDHVDEFYFSLLADTENLLPISDEKYADELQLQEVLISSAIAAVDRYGLPMPKRVKTEQTQQFAKIKTEPGQSSEATSCKICCESRPPSSIFINPNCSHSFCNDCVSRYIGTKIKDNISSIKCPEEDCIGAIHPESCQGIVPKQVFERWGSALCESMVLGANKFSYCPFKDCSALLLGDEEGGRVVQSECPNCRRLFCAKCEVAWHFGVSCEEFERLGPDERGNEDLKLVEVAKSKKWKRCPQCKFYVEKTQGCLHVTCRCGFEFCYGCGEKWGDTHASCAA